MTHATHAKRAILTHETINHIMSQAYPKPSHVAVIYGFTFSKIPLNSKQPSKVTIEVAVFSKGITEIHTFDTLIENDSVKHKAANIIVSYFADQVNEILGFRKYTNGDQINTFISDDEITGLMAFLLEPKLGNSLPKKVMNSMDKYTDEKIKKIPVNDNYLVMYGTDICIPMR